MAQVAAEVQVKARAAKGRPKVSGERARDALRHFAFFQVCVPNMVHVSHSLNSFKGHIEGTVKGSTMEAFRGDTRGLDFNVYPYAIHIS